MPPEQTSSPRQLPRPYAKPLSNDDNIVKTTTFCSTCLKNQHLLTETLANYLPSSDDPSYERYEASYPEFRRKLEERYPQVCALCEPEARRRLQQAGYTAKSDHLKRMMERSRARRIASRWGWRRMVVTLGAMFFWMSIIGQLVWSLVSLLEDPMKRNHQIGIAIASRPLQCCSQILTGGNTGLGCALAFRPMGFAAIVLGFISSWWNPKWEHKLQGLEGRLVGLREYYQVNTAVLLARLGVWIWADNSTILSSTENGQKVTHSVVMFMTLLFSIYALTRVKINTTPLVSWQDSPVQLLSSSQYHPPDGSGVPRPPLSTRFPRLGSPESQPFPVSSLAPESGHKVWQAPTPPPEEDLDAMEWEPSQTFQPKPRRPEVNAVPGPSPFHGALPAMPTNRLLHPQPQRRPARKEAIGIPPGFFDKRTRLKSESEPAFLPEMAQPRFFSQGDREADTGLESIFDTVFSLRDGPAFPKATAEQKLSARQQQQDQNVFERPHSASDTSLSCFIKLNIAHSTKFIIFAISSIIWFAALEPQPENPLMKLVLICIAGSMSLSSAISESKSSNLVPDISNLVWSGVMAFVAGFLAFQRWSQVDRKATERHDRQELIFLFACSCWELPRLFDWKQRRTSMKRFSSLPHGLPSSNEVRHPLPSEDQSSVSRGPKWQREELPSCKPAEASQATEHRPLYRVRSDSTDSWSSQNSTTTVDTATTAGWQTPNFRTQYSGGALGQSPGFNLRGLALDEATPTPRRREQNGFVNRRRRL